MKFNEKLSQNRIFFIALLIGLLVWALNLLRIYLIIREYKNPSPIIPYPSLFEYSAYSLVVFLFPYSWNRFNVKSNRLLYTAGVSLLFVLVYVFIHSTLDWFFFDRDYNLWNGYLFSIYHSGLIVLLVYVVISAIIYFIASKLGEVDGQKYLEQISYKLKGRTYYAKIQEVQLLEANDNYVSVHFDNGNTQLIRKTLSEFESQLNPSMFQRIHRKYIVNKEKVSSSKINDGGQTVLTMANGTELVISKTYKTQFKNSL